MSDYPAWILIIEDGLDFVIECGACGDRVRGYASREAAERAAREHECTEA